MTIAAEYLKAKSAELFIDGIRRRNFAHAAINLQIVIINNKAKVIQLVVIGKHSRFPNLTLLDLTVTQDGICPIVLAVQFSGQGHAHRGRDALAKASGGHIHAFDMMHLRMAGHMPVQPAEGLQLLLGK